MVSIRLRFFGAAGEVTGSMHLLEVNGQTIALDCGMFHGRRGEANAKNTSWPCPPSTISAVILSHPHIDHCGKLPRLVRDGFSGPIYATPAACDLASVMLADSAHIQEEDAIYWNKKRVARGDAPIEPLYTKVDAEAASGLLEHRPLNAMFEVIPGLRCRLHEAGHMLGSAGVYLEIDNGAQPVRLVYTGDLGRPHMPILRDPAPLPECDYLICESTYGGRETAPPQSMQDKLVEIVNSSIEAGGKIVVPSFAVGRTQVLVYDYHRALHDNKLHQHIPVIVDSPLAVRATEVYVRHPETFDTEAFKFNSLTGNMLKCDNCEYIENVEHSKALHGRSGPMMIVSASGMCEVGRILHHLKNNITDGKNTILIVGFQAAHTLGRRLVEKQKRVKIFGETYPVRAKVKVLNGYSAHANSRELLAATSPIAGAVKTAFLVHGEPDQMKVLAAGMTKQGYRSVVSAEPGKVVELN